MLAKVEKTVLKMGGVGSKFDVIYIGTILHYDSVLSRILNNPLWRTARFKALLCWPSNMAWNGKAATTMPRIGTQQILPTVAFLLPLLACMA